MRVLFLKKKTASCIGFAMRARSSLLWSTSTTPVGQRDRDEALSFVAESLERFSFSDAPRIFSISARQALKAKQTQDREQLEGSGIQVFETELLRFLTEERAQSFLVNMYERTMTFLIQRSRSQEHPEYEDSYKAFIERFRDLQETVLGAASQEQEMISLEARADENSYPLQINRKTGCQICGSILEAMFRFLSKYQYQLTVNPEIQQEHARRGGFCTLHTWQYESISSPYGVCVAYPELAHRLAAELKEFTGPDSSPWRIHREHPGSTAYRKNMPCLRGPARSREKGGGGD